MFYKELEFDLNTIKKIINSPNYNKKSAFESHYKKLKEKKNKIEVLLTNIEKSILNMEGKIIMSDKEKFEGFKNEIIKQNEEKYGDEIRKKYGDDVIDNSNKKFMELSQKEYNDIELLNKELNETLKIAVENGNPQSDIAQKACELHKMWIMNYWKEYSKEAHMATVQMYVDDERFTKYYDDIITGCAVFLRDAMKIYLGIN